MQRERETFVDVPGGRVWSRSVGDGDGLPLLCLHGGPGFAHDYLEALEDLADGRQVIFYDQLGCGRSSRPSDPSLWTAERFVDELEAVRAALGLERFHLLGHSWGGMLAMQYVTDRNPPGLAGLVLVGSPASVPRYLEEVEDLLAQLPPELLASIREHEANGWTSCPEYHAAMLVFLRKHGCRLKPWPAGLERSYAAASSEVYTTMCGPSEFTVVGNLKDWDVLDRLDRITAPTLVLGGRHDHVQPRHLARIEQRIAGARLEIIEDASHHCFDEQRTVFMPLVQRFLEDVERVGA